MATTSHIRHHCDAENQIMSLQWLLWQLPLKNINNVIPTRKKCHEYVSNIFSWYFPLININIRWHGNFLSYIIQGVITMTLMRCDYYGAIIITLAGQQQLDDNNKMLLLWCLYLSYNCVPWTTVLEVNHGDFLHIHQQCDANQTMSLWCRDNLLTWTTAMWC